jgi:hypothetical protein
VGVPGHHGTVCPKVANGRNGLQMWIAGIILNKKSQTLTWGFGMGLRTLHTKPLVNSALSRFKFLYSDNDSYSGLLGYYTTNSE